MKISYPILAAWLLSIAATFGVAWTMKPASPKEPAADTGSRTGLSTIATATITRDDRTQPGDPAAVEAGLRTAGAIEPYLVGGAITAETMATAIRDMQRENDPIRKRAMFSQLLEQLTPDNAKAALLALRESGGRGRFDRRGGGDEERLLLHAWGRIDGAGAIAELEAMEAQRRAEREAEAAARGEAAGEGGQRGRGRGPGGPFGGFESTFDIASVLSGWATSDAGAAMAYVDGVEDERAKGMMTGNVIRGLLVNGVDDAVSFISTLPTEDENRGRHMWAVAEEVLENGTAEAAQWVTGLADDSLKDGAMRRIADSYARENLDEAIAWVGQHQGEDYARGAVTQVAERWAEDDPKAVIDWAASLPEETQKGVFQEALDEWTERDPLAASEYLANMQDSPVRDSAIQGFATELSREDPESAATWAATIADPEVRGETLVRVARDWMRADRAAAEAWLAGSGLSEEQQQQATEGGGRGFGPRGPRGR